jgi:hypothetical protein
LLFGCGWVTSPDVPAVPDVLCEDAAPPDVVGAFDGFDAWVDFCDPADVVVVDVVVVGAVVGAAAGAFA